MFSQDPLWFRVGRCQHHLTSLLSLTYGARCKPAAQPTPHTLHSCRLFLASFWLCSVNLLSHLIDPTTKARTMESAEQAFGGLKRRTTDLMNSMPNMPKPSMPNMPNMPSMPNMPTELPQMPQLPQFPSLADLSSRLPKMPAWGAAHPSKPTVKATWERIDVPSLPRSSHSVNIVSGNAYIFGGEIEPRKPVDNDMHVIVLPYSSANADYYNVKAKAAPRAAPLQIPTVIEPIAEEEAADKGKEKDLSEVDLASPAQESASAITAADSIADGPDPSVSKGKEPARVDADISALGDVPMPRVGHATAVIGNRIFMFGGRGGPDMKPLEEYGRVWVFDTKTHLWSYLDPYLPAAEPMSPAFADKRKHYPVARSYHSAAGVDLPRDFPAGPGVPPGMRKLKRTSTWTEWAQGDSNMVGTPQQPIVGNIANNSRDEDDDGYGTLIVHGGCLSEGRANDTWAFDMRSRVWQELPSAPGQPRGGTSIAVASSKLWRFGGFNGETEEGGQLDYLELGVDDMAERSGDGEIFLSARGGWKSLLPEDLPGAAAAAAPKVEAAAGEHEAAKPLTETEAPYWPGHRSVAGMQTVTIGGSSGREYLLLVLGERDPSNNGHEAAGKFWDDVWAYELPRPTAASSVMGAVFGRARNGSSAALEEGKWFRVETEAYDDDDPYAAAGPGPRGWFASAHMGELEERGLVVWGGLDGANKRLGDGWILRMGNEKREP